MKSQISALLACVATIAAPVLADDKVSPPLEIEDASVGRIRWGINGNIGYFAPPTAFMLGLEGRLGYQLTRNYAVYANLSGGFGVGPGEPVNEGISVSVAAPVSLGAIFEYTVFDRFSVAAGPMIAAATWGSSINTGGKVRFPMLASGVMPGLDAKIMYHFTSPNPQTGRRSGFTIGLDMQTLFAPNARYTAADGTTTTRLAVGYVPTIMLGFDAR